MMEEGKLCPFCVDDELRQFDDGSGVLCINCGMVGPSIGTDPVDAWNALPRREDFHAELMKIIELVVESSVYQFDKSTVLCELRHFASKYTPAQPDKGER